MSTVFELFSGRQPASGVVTLRDPRFVPDQAAEILDDGFIDNIAVEKRLGWAKKSHLTLGGSCKFFNGSSDYINVSGVPADNLGTIWTQEFSVFIPDFLPTADSTIFARRTNVANTDHFWFYVDAATGKFRLQFDTASEAVDLSGTTIVAAKTRYLVSWRRSGGTVKIFVDGVDVGTFNMGAGAAEVNKAIGGRWIYGARNDDAAGDEATDQHSRMYLGEHRDWTVARSDSDIDDNKAVEIDPADNTGLRHYRRGRVARNKRIFYDSDDHSIPISSKRHGWHRGCGPVSVDRHYPERCASWDEASPGIARGEEWRRYDGVGVGGVGQHDQEAVPDAKVEDLVNRLQDGKAQWGGRIEFIAERTGVLECLADWALGAASDLPAMRLEKTAADKMQLTTRISGANQVVLGTVSVADCRPYAVDFIRNNTDWRMIVYRIDTGALLEEIAIVVPSALGDTAAGGPVTLGKQRNNSNPFQGAIGNADMFRFAVGPTATAAPSPLRKAQAVWSVPAKRLGRRVHNYSSGTDLVPDCVPVDLDIPDGPIPTDCSGGTKPLSMAHFHGLYDYQRTSSKFSSVGIQRTLIVSFGGAIYEAIQRKDGLDLVFEIARRGISGGRTALSDWAQQRDELVHVNGLDVNLVRDRDQKWAKLGVEPPGTAVVLAENGAGNLKAGATYTYFPIFRDPVTGAPSLPGPTTTITIGATDAKVAVSSIPLSTDPDRPNMIREIYRTQWGIGGQGVDFYKVLTIKDNFSTGPIDDDLADTFLLPALKIEQDEFGFFVGAVAPISRYAVTHRSRLFLAGDPEHPTRLSWSRVGAILSFPVSYFVDLADEGTGSPITALWEVYDRLFIGTENDIWELKATSRIGTFRLNKVVRNIGPSGQWSTKVYQATTFFWNAGEKKLYSWDGQGEPKYLSWRVEPTIEAFNGDAMQFGSAAPYQARTQMWFTASTGTTDDSKEGDEGIPENDKMVVYDISRDAFTFLNMDVNVLGVVEDPATQRNGLCAGDYMGFVRDLDVGFSDGYDQVGAFDKRGQIAAAPAPTTTVLELLDHAGAAPTLPTTDDGLMGCPFFLIRTTNGVRSVVAKSRVYFNTTTRVTLQTALSVAPLDTDEWAIGGIHFRHKSVQLDFNRSYHNKALLDVIFQHRLETGDAQEGVNRLTVHTYQDDAAVGRPDSREHDLTTGQPSTSPDKRMHVEKNAKYHAVEFESFMPDWPCKVEGASLRYEESDQPVGAT